LYRLLGDAPRKWLALPFVFCSYAQKMPSAPPNSEQSDTDLLEAAADEAIAACGGDAREAVKALIVANHFLETELEKLRAEVSAGYCARQTAAA
jgi:hypothetical protein